MRFVCKNGCGYTHENENGMHWIRADDDAISKHGKECPKKC